MDAFWCITLSILVIRSWLKRQSKRAEEEREDQQIQESKLTPKLKDTDELIAVILPTINNGQ